MTNQEKYKEELQEIRKKIEETRKALPDSVGQSLSIFRHYV